jgi:membrane protein DedA with SNARE-associated domain
MTDAAIQLPLGFHEWFPAAQAAALAVLTFVQEDAPTVSAALLSAAGGLNTATGFLGCFFGIWIGDALLYLIARGFGRPILNRPWVGKFLNPASVARSEQWFAERGTWLLLSSRMIPGTRLPTYLAAGFLRVPFSKFLLVTGIAVAAWTVTIFLLARTFGSRLVHFLERWQGGGWALLTVALALLAVIRFSIKLADTRNRRRIAVAFGRWTRWEFWPAWLFYIPVLINYLWLAIRYRGLTLPTAANPGIFSGGIVGESKIATLRELQATSSEFTAEAHLIEGASVEERQEELQRLITASDVSYPLILKPDVGQRGVGVKLIREERQARGYLTSTNAPLICQRYAPGPFEIGVFYYRFPDEPRGCIFSITEKFFPIIIGDGVRSVEELIWADLRARFIADKYLARLGVRRDEILPKGEALKLVEAGNHAQGCIFQDGMHLCSEELERRIDEISQKVNGFFIGRYDIRYSSEDDLRAGRNFQIIELNGAASEATSIYDARNSLWSAYRTLFRQWELVFAIGAANRRSGSSPTTLSLLWRTWRQTAALTTTYPAAD